MAGHGVRGRANRSGRRRVRSQLTVRRPRSADQPAPGAGRMKVMDVSALFDKLRTDLAPLGVEEARDDAGARVLTRDGVPFARLGLDERMAFRAVGGGAVRQHADRLVTAQDQGDWVIVPADDVAEWEALARKALSML